MNWSVGETTRLDTGSAFLKWDIFFTTVFNFIFSVALINNLASYYSLHKTMNNKPHYFQILKKYTNEGHTS
jgi:hypothetical protein